MKKLNVMFTIMLSLGVLFFGVFAENCFSAGFGRGNGNMNGANGMNCTSLVSGYPYQDLNDEERAGLLKMREEEKLARDVYLTLYNQWNHRIFRNIANSEQRHMDAVKSLLDKYGLTDPVIDDNMGIFTDSNMTELFNTLVGKGSVSLTDALLAGATIEDLDIYDLNTLLSQTDNEDIQAVYKNLNRGSMNHMRAFTRVLNNYGVTYSPQYISQQDLDDILAGSWK